MPWPILIQLIATHGPKLAFYLAEKWGKKEDPTPEEMAELRALINKPGEDYFK